MNFFPGLALNHSLPDLCRLSRWDYRREPLCLTWYNIKWPHQPFNSGFLLSAGYTVAIQEILITHMQWEVILCL
jgi:hypothetical protein